MINSECKWVNLIIFTEDAVHVSSRSHAFRLLFHFPGQVKHKLCWQLFNSHKTRLLSIECKLVNFIYSYSLFVSSSTAGLKYPAQPCAWRTYGFAWTQRFSKHQRVWTTYLQRCSHDDLILSPCHAVQSSVQHIWTYYYQTIYINTCVGEKTTWGSDVYISSSWMRVGSFCTKGEFGKRYWWTTQSTPLISFYTI